MIAKDLYPLASVAFSKHFMSKTILADRRKDKHGLSLVISKLKLIMSLIIFPTTISLRAL